MTLEEKIDVKLLLQVFQNIVTHGVPDKSKDIPAHRLEGIYATSDFDGYTIVLFNDYARITVQFHSKYSFDYSNRHERLVFLEKLQHIYNAYGNGK